MVTSERGRPSYPRLEIAVDRLRHNSETLVGLCRRSGIQVAGVTKAFCGNAVLAGAMAAGGVYALADSRIDNLRRLRDSPLPKLLLRLPMISQANDVVEHADISLNSELETLRALSAAACRRGKIHRVILMVDLGDLREGFFDQAELFRAVAAAQKLEGIVVAGLGTNLTCYGGVIPTTAHLERLLSLSLRIEQDFGIGLETVSGGNSSSLYLLGQGAIPHGITELRLGEAIILGRETAYGQPITGTHGDCFRLMVEIVEIKDKPSLPAGQLGRDAFGRAPRFVDRGIRRRAICAVGRQDVDPQCLVPADAGIVVVGASSDHLIVDVTDSRANYRVADTVPFGLTYAGILSCMTSEYVSKQLVT